MTVSKITNDHLDELVCGDVHPKRYREILSGLDAEPEKWRDCALAFLQEQAIASEMQRLADDDANWDGFTRREANADSRKHVAQHVQLGTRTRQSETEKLHKLQRWTSIAASVLIAFTVGWVGSGFTGSSLTGSSFTGSSQSSSGSSISSASTSENVQLADNPPAVDSRPALRSDWNQGPTFASNESLVLDNEVPAELVKLERLGYRIESTSQLVPVELSNGRSAIVPIKTYRALPPALPY